MHSALQDISLIEPIRLIALYRYRPIFEDFEGAMARYLTGKYQRGSMSLEVLQMSCFVISLSTFLDRAQGQARMRRTAMASLAVQIYSFMAE